METWRDVVGYEGRYEVSDQGNIRNAETKRIRKTQDDHGYRKVGLSINGTSKNFFIHRLVAIAFIPNPENKPQVNHKDGVHNNNRVENLEWVTPEENFEHAVENHLYEKGMAKVKELGHGQYSKKNKPKDYLSNSEFITKEGHDAIVNVAKSLNVSATKLASVIQNLANNDDFDIDFKSNKIKVSESFIKRIEAPLVKKQEALLEEINELKRIRNEYLSAKSVLSKFEQSEDNSDLYIGAKRNMLTIIGYSKSINGKNLVCQCDCGNIVLESPCFWRSGKVKSCGCMHDELAKAANPIDECKQDWLYSLWVRRYRQPIWYEGWKDYSNFYNWSYANGYEFGKKLYRKDVNKAFYPENCEWREGKPQQATKHKQEDLHVVNGELLSVSDACRKYNMVKETIRYRMKRGLTLEEAINTPLCTNGRKSNRIHLTEAS